MSSLTVYKASAGSGKTFTLAVQYIKLLVMAEEPAEYARILAVTFTNKATGEMKDRILSQLYGIGHSLSGSQAYFKALRAALRNEAADMFTDDELRRRCREALHQILHDYSRFRVQTIDAFFQTILRGLAHELGLTANLQVEISDAEVLSKAVDRIVDRLQDEPQVFEWLYSLVRERIANDQRWDVTREVKNFGRAIFNEDYLLRGEQLRQRLTDPDFMRTFIRQLNEMSAIPVERLKSAGAQIEHAVYDAGISYTDFSNGKTLSVFVEHLKDGDIDVEPGALITKWASNPLTMVRKADQHRSELIEAADVVGSLLSDLVESLPKIQFQANSARLALAHLKPLCLLDAIDREVADINAETSRFNLAKTPILLSRMVGESDAPFVFEKIGALLHHVMIDEFQDTSSLQWKNFRVLLLESLAKGGRNLLVGDVKQSIYRWRGGDWRILGNIEHGMMPPPQIQHLNVNRRSADIIIHFNNEFFREAARSLDQVSAVEITILRGTFSFVEAYADVKQYTPAEDAAAVGGSTSEPQASLSSPGFVSVTVLNTADYPKRSDWQPVILEDVKEQVRELHAKGLPYSAMTILVRNNSDMAPIIDSFAEDADMPPIVSDEAFLLSASPAVEAIIAALRVLDDDTDVISAYYLRTQIPSLPPEGLSTELFRLPLYELVETLYRDLHLDAFAHQDAYIFGFFDAVLDFQHSESADIHSFLAYWDERLSRQAIPAGQVNGIRIMTIHKAKGLEFHTVFMPFCTWAFERDRATDLLWCAPSQEPFNELQLLPITPNSKTAPNSVFNRDYAEEHLLSRLDELNALYVGFTRPACNFYAWAVGNADGLNKSKRTVGDLIATIIPNGTLLGEPMLTSDEANDGKKSATKQENRLTPTATPIDITMHSYPLSATFRQSNRSQDFLASLPSQTEALDDEEASMVDEHYRQQQYLELGRLLHSVLQQIATLDDVPRVLDSLEHEGVISRFAPDGTYVSVRRSDLETWFARGFSNPQVASWFSDEWTLFNECSIVSLDAETRQPVNHRPDRVMVSADGTRVVVVDFKFGRPRSTYEQQVKNYMSLLAAMYPAAIVEGYLWFVYSSRVTPVSLP